MLGSAQATKTRLLCQARASGLGRALTSSGTTSKATAQARAARLRPQTTQLRGSSSTTRSHASQPAQASCNDQPRACIPSIDRSRLQPSCRPPRDSASGAVSGCPAGSTEADGCRAETGRRDRAPGADARRIRDGNRYLAINRACPTRRSARWGRFGKQRARSPSLSVWDNHVLRGPACSIES